MAISQLPQTPNVGPEVPKDLWRWLIELGNRIRALISTADSYDLIISATEPAIPRANKTVWFDTTAKALKLYNGSTWDVY